MSLQYPYTITTVTVVVIISLFMYIYIFFDIFRAILLRRISDLYYSFVVITTIKCNNNYCLYVPVMVLYVFLTPTLLPVLFPVLHCSFCPEWEELCGFLWEWPFSCHSPLWLHQSTSMKTEQHWTLGQCTYKIRAWTLWILLMWREAVIQCAKLSHIQHR